MFYKKNILLRVFDIYEREIHLNWYDLRMGIFVFLTMPSLSIS
jgi:hypothetical protein